MSADSHVIPVPLGTLCAIPALNLVHFLVKVNINKDPNLSLVIIDFDYNMPFGRIQKLYYFIYMYSMLHVR